jgi:hypothetical protein
MTNIAGLKKAFGPFQENLATVQAAIQDAFKARHDEYMSLNGELRTLREMAPSRSELEGLLGVFLEGFLSAEQAKFDRLVSVFRANVNPAIERKTTLEMFRADENRPAVLWAIAAPALRESVRKAAATMPWPDSLEPAERLQKISDLEQRIAAVTAEMDELQAMAAGMNLTLSQ